MSTTEHREPYEPRGSRTDLGARGGEIPLRDSPTDADDLKNANEQNTAMKAAKISLSSATMQAVTANAGYNAVKAVPTTKNGHPVADISLIKGES